MSKKWKPKSRAGELHGQRGPVSFGGSNSPKRHAAVDNHGAPSTKRINDIQGLSGQRVDYAYGGGGRSSGGFDHCRNQWGETKTKESY